MNPLKLEQKNDGMLWLIREDDEDVAVKVRRAFPWSAPDRFISLCDEKDHEVAMIDQLDDLEPEERQLIEQALMEAGFILDIEAIDEIDNEYEIRNWKVRTRQGPITFQTKHDEWPRPLQQGGYLIRGIEGLVLRFPEPETMDEKSRKILWAYAD
ncbi:DUF1854 domain-containing protein [Candidatus Sumerlaeota bacterium]|nr:DUF1854 domain-containing protein [Candidatus Sumerlaeota bacterium]